MLQIILILHLLVALAIIGLILLQRGKGADMGASFGGGASQTVFGSSGGGNVLSTMTGLLAALFFATSFGLAIVADQQYSENDELGFEVPTNDAPLIPELESDLPMFESSEQGGSDLPISLPD